MLGIESSCDDTGVAVVTPDGAILGQALATQEDVHRCAAEDMRHPTRNHTLDMQHVLYFSLCHVPSCITLLCSVL